METNYRKSKSKNNELFTVINFDYEWIFFNGIETAQKGGNYKSSLKQMYSDSREPSLILKSNNKEF